MSRVLHAIEKGLRIYQENSALFIDILTGTAAPDGLLDQSAASIGSLYVREGTGELYQKILNNGNSGDWQLNSPTSSSVVGNWRPESLIAVTNEVQGAGTRDMVVTPFTDDNGTPLPVSAFVVNKHVITDADGTPVLLRISAVSGDDVTFVAAASPLVADDTFYTKNYLPDADGFENGAIVVYDGTIINKIADVDWNFATGISLSSGYAANNSGAVISNADSVESAIAKLDGRSVKRVQVAALTTLATVDSVLVDDVKAVHWKIHVFEDANPARIKSMEVFATHNGTSVADATQADDTVYAQLRIGTNFNLNISVDINGTGAGQTMRLRASSSTAGVTVTAIREEIR
ncbi:MAG: hypothetical protein BWY19_00812 [bacterium ADurb.Bin212]|nr:MAG: hypothetical protein BWY19_00812 [bacterium ADurb.Bin212]